MQTLSEIKMLLAERGLRPKHRLGQNFLHDKNQIAKLIEAAEIKSGDLVLEIGPGTGTLTGALLERGAEVIACEIDAGLADLVQGLFENAEGSFTLIRGDAMAKQRQLNAAVVEATAGRMFKLVANLPYQIASPLISALLIDHPNCNGLFVTIQKEVADRLVAKPGTKEYGALSIIVQAIGDVHRIGTISASCFWPQPEVTSAMVSISPIGDSPVRVEGDRFSRFVVELFSKRRKQLGTTFGRDRSEWRSLADSGISP
jgi:16S rRNA (adenine1518-N6/adenine1519-N6)-dimethyltransferase